MKKIKFLLFIALIFLGVTNVKAANLSYSNATYSYSPVYDAGVYYYYGGYVSNSAIGTATNTTTSNRYAGRMRIYTYFTSANALRTSNQYQIKARVCSDNGTFGYDVEQAVPTFIHYAYNTTNSMTGAINGSTDDAIMTYSRVSSDTHCMDFTFTFTPRVDSLRAVGFWVTFSRLDPVSTCWEGDCSNEHRQDTYLVSTLNANTGSFNVNSLNVTYVQSGTSTAVLEQQQQIMIQQQQQINNNINNINNNINDDDTEDEASDFASFLNSFSTDTHGLTGIITAPLTAIQSLTSATCQPLVLPLPFMTNQNLTLPCMRPIYEQHFGAFIQLYDVITFGIVAYWVCIRIFAMVKDFKNPEHDEIEVMDL